MAETTNKKQGNSNAGVGGKITGTVKAAKPSKSKAPAVAPKLADLLEGFTPDEVASLIRTKEAVEKGRYTDITNEHRKLLFVKWLIEHDKLAS